MQSGVFDEDTLNLSLELIKEFVENRKFPDHARTLTSLRLSLEPRAAATLDLAAAQRKLIADSLSLIPQLSDPLPQLLRILDASLADQTEKLQSLAKLRRDRAAGVVAELQPGPCTPSAAGFRDSAPVASSTAASPSSELVHGSIYRPKVSEAFPLDEVIGNAPFGGRFVSSIPLPAGLSSTGFKGAPSDFPADSAFEAGRVPNESVGTWSSEPVSPTLRRRVIEIDEISGPSSRFLDAVAVESTWTTAGSQRRPREHIAIDEIIQISCD